MSIAWSEKTWKLSEYHLSFYVSHVMLWAPVGAKVKSECKHCLFSGLNICVCFRDIYLFTGLFRSRIYKTFTPKCLDFSFSAFRLESWGWRCSKIRTRHISLHLSHVFIGLNFNQMLLVVVSTEGGLFQGI